MKASKKRYKTSRPAPSPTTRRRWEFLVIVAAILLIAAGGVMVWAQSGNEPGAPVEVRSAPRVAVAQDAVDHGDLKFETPVSSVFQVSNIGDQPLQILGEPQVELVEGC